MARLLSDRDAHLHVPHLLDLEVMSALRRLVRRGHVSADRAAAGWRLVSQLVHTRRWHLPLLERLWTQRGDLTPYDATYVALAEALDATLVTADPRLVAVPVHHARILVV